MSDSSDTVTPLATPVKHTAAYRFLVAAVILLGALIVIALAALVVGLSMRLGGHGTQHSDSALPAQLTLTPGTRIVSTDVSGDRLVLRLKGSFGDEIDIIDMQTGRLVARLRSAAPPKKQ